MSDIQQFDYSVNLLQALLWQYDDAPHLKSIATQKDAWFAGAQTAFWSDWYRDVFNLETANDFGLGIWARILNVPLVVGQPASDWPVFGFADYNENFDQAGFGINAGSSINLTTEQKRLVLKLRAFQLITRGAVTEVNAFLAQLFGDMGSVYVLDGEDMTCTYIFNFIPSSAVLFVLRKYDLLPRPAGVEAKILINPSDSFGFAPYYLNFDNGSFAE